MNKEEKAGFSVTKVVSADDEWCAEAYMETDYSKLSKNHLVVLKNWPAMKEL